MSTGAARENRTANAMNRDKEARKKKVTGEYKRRKPVTMFEILSRMIGELSGKNSIGKLVQYLIKFLVYHSGQFQKSFLAHNTKLLTLVTVEKARLKQWTHLLLTNPVFVVNYIKLLLFRQYIDRLEGVANGLSLFRQTLRFGKTPFRVVSLTQNVSNNISNGNIKKYVASYDFITDFIDTSYGIVDELGLLFKLRFYKTEQHPKAKKIISKADEIIWLADILCQLRISSLKLSKLQVAKETLIREGLDDEKISAQEYAAQIDDLDHQINITTLGLYKNTCDLGFDLIDLFSLGISKYVYYALGFGSGLFNTVKTYQAVKKSLCL